MYARLCSYANSMLASINMQTVGVTRHDAVAHANAGTHVPRLAAQWDDPPLAIWRQALFGTFAALPTDVLARIAGYVKDDDLSAWSRICRGAHGMLRREYLARRLPATATAVVTLRMLQKAVPDILRFASRPGHWLAVLARQLPLLDTSEVATAFALLLDAGDRLPLDERPPLWQALAVGRYECGEDRKHCPIGSKLELRLYRAVVSLHGIDHGHTFAAFMTYCSDQFAVSFSHGGWDADVAAMPPAAQAGSLAALQARADRLGCLPHAAFLARLQLAMSTPSEDRHLALAALAVPNAYLQSAEASRRLAVLLPAVQSLPPHQQPVCHAALAYLILPLPAEAIAPAWRRLLAAMPDLEPYDGAGEVLRALHVGIAFMTPRDGAACRQQLEDYRRASTVHIPSLPAAVAELAEPVRRHGWDVRLQAEGVDFYVRLPFRADSPGSRRARAYQAMTQHLAVDPVHQPPQSPALRAARVRADAARLGPTQAGDGGGFSFDVDSELAAWNAVLQRIQGLPQAVQLEPLRELARVSARSIPLFTPRVFMLSMGFPTGRPSPTEQCWDALTNAVRQLPLEQQLDLARDIAQFAGSRSALSWSTAMAARAPLQHKATMLMRLARGSTAWVGETRATVWRAVFHVALSLPAAQRAGVLRALKQVLPKDSPGRLQDEALLEDQLLALPEDV